MESAVMEGSDLEGMRWQGNRVPADTSGSRVRVRVHVRVRWAPSCCLPHSTRQRCFLPPPGIAPAGCICCCCRFFGLRSSGASPPSPVPQNSSKSIARDFQRSPGSRSCTGADDAWLRSPSSPPSSVAFFSKASAPPSCRFSAGLFRAATHGTADGGPLRKSGPPAPGTEGDQSSAAAAAAGAASATPDGDNDEDDVSVRAKRTESMMDARLVMEPPSRAVPRRGLVRAPPRCVPAGPCQPAGQSASCQSVA
jgi:hypothetical protein